MKIQSTLKTQTRKVVNQTALELENSRVIYGRTRNIIKNWNYVGRRCCLGEKSRGRCNGFRNLMRGGVNKRKFPREIHKCQIINLI